MLFIRILREKINVRIYNSKNLVQNSFSFLSILVSLFAFGNIIYYYGFPKTTESVAILEYVIKGSFIFYVTRYLVCFFYSFEPLQYLKTTWFEGVMMIILIMGGVGAFLLRFFLSSDIIETTGIIRILPLTYLVIQFIFFVIIAIELGKVSQHFSHLKMGPASLLTFSFVVLILSGAGLLMLPEMTTGHQIRFIDSLFTSTSASCVTGLIVVDTATYFTLKGKIIIMLLIQFGGINIISFATFFATFYRKASGIKHMTLLKELTSTSTTYDSKNILRKVIFYSIIIEGIGALLLFFLWNNSVDFKGGWERFFYSVFHSVSAFNNAGFALFTNNMYENCIRHAYWIHLVLAGLIFLGGLGFIVIQDLIGVKQLRERIKYPWKTLQIGTKVALNTSIALIIVGAVIFFFLEKNSTIKDYSIFGAITTSIFQSVSTRTAGFNTVDFSVLSQPVLIMMIFLMFIGASPGSTGGGIKTTTFAILFKSALATIRGKKNVELYKKSVSFDLIDRAYVIALFAVSLIFISSFGLSITDGNFSFLQILFEEVSAFGTVGLSTGITPFLSDAGKYILILTMFIGRIGPLTLALVLTRRAFYTKHKYPNASIMIG